MREADRAYTEAREAREKEEADRLAIEKEEQRRATRRREMEERFERRERAEKERYDRRLAECKAVALTFNTRGEFREGAPKDYDWLKRNFVLEVVLDEIGMPFKGSRKPVDAAE